MPESLLLRVRSPVSLVSNLTSAFGLLTALPVSGKRTLTLTPDTAAFFPLVGLVIGVLSLGLLEAARSASVVSGTGNLLENAGSLLGAILVVLTTLGTRSLHWDGLADTADAIWSLGDTDRKLEIMADSATGAFGAASIVIVAVTQVAAYGSILQAPGVLGWTILATPVLGRAAASFAAWLGTPARPGGLGSSIMGRPHPGHAILFGATVIGSLAVVVIAHQQVGLIWSVFALLVAPVVPHFIASRIGGVTGDVMGASVAITETILLASAGVLSAL